jgi:hypothetical protein
LEGVKEGIITLSKREGKHLIKVKTPAEFEEDEEEEGPVDEGMEGEEGMEDEGPYEVIGDEEEGSEGRVIDNEKQMETETEDYEQLTTKKRNQATSSGSEDDESGLDEEGEEPEEDEVPESHAFDVEITFLNQKVC